MTGIIEVIREDDTGRVQAAFPVLPQRGDVIHLDSPHRNLAGRFAVRRREIGGGRLGAVKLIVEAA